MNHDLRAPLAAIVNYAAALEETVDPAQLRATTQRIRHHALQSADMLQALLEATALAARPAESLRVRIEPLEIVKSTILDGGIEDLVDLRAGAAAREPLDLDADLVRYAIGAFLALECSSRARRPLDVRVVRAPSALAIELAFAGDPAAELAPVALEMFVQGYDEESPRAARFALALARELHGCYGGELVVAGRASQEALLRLVQPVD